jgi:hypothetical protein
LQAELAALPDSHGWDARTLALTIDHDGPVPPLPSRPRTLRPDAGRIETRSRIVRPRAARSRTAPPAAAPTNVTPSNAAPTNVTPTAAMPTAAAPAGAARLREPAAALARKARESLFSTGFSPEPEVIRAGAGHDFVPRPYDPGVGLSPHWPLNADWPPAGTPKAGPPNPGPPKAGPINPS